MKRFAFISDVHSNLPALKSALDDIKTRGVDRVYCLGDLIGYHCFPNEVIELLQAEDVVCLKGNHDEAITEEMFDRSNKGDFPLYWNFDALTEENALYLRHLPNSIEFHADDINIVLVHGSPESISEYIREDSHEMAKYFDYMKSDILVCAHTHLPYHRELDGKWLINTGSIGKPKIGRPEISYILLTVDGSDVVPEVITSPYPYREMIDALEEKKFPKKLIDAIESGNP